MAGLNSLQDKIRNEVTELAGSLKEIVDKFNQLQHPIEESHVKVPKATKQLDKISEQTEVATQRMLDTIEAITEREQEVSSGLKKIQDCTTVEQINSSKELIAELIEKSDANCNDAYSIMDTLQFQDITAQQMDHAASLLEDIEVKLHQIIKVMDGDQTESKPEDSNKKERAYDPHADMFESKTNQQDIDSIFQKK